MAAPAIPTATHPIAPITLETNPIVPMPKFGAASKKDGSAMFRMLRALIVPVTDEEEVTQRLTVVPAMAFSLGNPATADLSQTLDANNKVIKKGGVIAKFGSYKLAFSFFIQECFNHWMSYLPAIAMLPPVMEALINTASSAIIGTLHFTPSATYPVCMIAMRGAVIMIVLGIQSGNGQCALMISALVADNNGQINIIKGQIPIFIGGVIAAPTEEKPNNGIIDLAKGRGTYTGRTSFLIRFGDNNTIGRFMRAGESAEESAPISENTKKVTLVTHSRDGAVVSSGEILVASSTLPFFRKHGTTMAITEASDDEAPAPVVITRPRIRLGPAATASGSNNNGWATVARNQPAQVPEAAAAPALVPAPATEEHADQATPLLSALYDLHATASGSDNDDEPAAAAAAPVARVTAAAKPASKPATGAKGRKNITKTARK